MMSCVLRNSGLSSIKFLCATLSHMSIGAGIVISISFQKIDDAPRAQTGAQRDNQNLQGINSRSEKTHIRVITALSNEK